MNGAQTFINTILSKKDTSRKGILLSGIEHLSTGKADKLNDLLYSLNSDVEKNNPTVYFSFLIRQCGQS